MRDGSPSAAPAKRVAEIKQQVVNLRREIAALEAEADALKQDLAGVHVGDVVIVTQRGRDPFEVRVASVDTRWDTPWIIGFKRKKDGSWGSQAHRYYSDWKATDA